MNSDKKINSTSGKTLELFRSLFSKNSINLNHFWSQVEKEGTPLVEKIDSHHSRVIFIYRNLDHNTENVIITQYGLASFDRREWGMSLIDGTDVWYLEKILPVGCRLVYAIQKNTPMIYMADSKGLEEIAWSELIARCFSDPFNFHPYVIPKKFALGNQDLSMSVFYHPQVNFSKYPVSKKIVKSKLINQTVSSQFLFEKQRDLTIYIPENYEVDDFKNQNLLIIFDGDAYLDFIPTPQILDHLIEQKIIPKTIAIFIKNPDPNPDTRLRDFIANKKFYQFITDEMMPWIQGHYAYNSSQTIVGGSSAGGWAAAYCTLFYPSLFPKALLQSPAMMWPVEGEENWLLNQYIDLDLSNRYFYIDVGTLENAQWFNHGLSFVQCAKFLKAILQSKKVPVHFHEFPGGHDYLSWETTFSQGLQYLNRFS